MNREQIFICLIKTVHEIGSTVWVGSLFFLAVLFLPMLNKISPKTEDFKKFTSNIYKKLIKIIFITVVVLFITGIILAKNNPLFEGLFHFSNLYTSILSIKVFLVIIMFIISMLRRKNLKKSLQTNNIQYRKIDKYILINFILGCIIILLSSFISIL